MNTLLARLRRGAVPTMAAAVVLLGPTTAHANHLPHFGPAWVTNPTIQITNGFPGGEFEARITSARNEWNSLGTTRPIGIAAGRIADFNPQTQCGNAGAISVHWRETGAMGFPNALGLSNFCTINNGAERHSAWMAFDTDRDWYSGVGDANDGFLQQCIPSCQEDFWSVVSHELGHTMGFNHFTEEDVVCPNGDLRHTMCPGIYSGTERQRSYEIHEEEAFHIRY